MSCSNCASDSECTTAELPERVGEHLFIDIDLSGARALIARLADARHVPAFAHADLTEIGLLDVVPSARACTTAS